MSSIRDGEACNYLPESEGIPLISVGWLEAGDLFPRGKVSKEFFDKLCQDLTRRWKPPFVMTGFHDCSLCQFSICTTSRFKDHVLGSRSNAELYVPDGRQIYVTPVSIAHYIDAHDYCPPDDFVKALMVCPEQSSVAYLKLLLKSGGRDWMARFERRGG